MDRDHHSTPQDLASLLEAVRRFDARLDAKPSGLQARVRILRNFTIEGLEPHLKYDLYSSGIQPEVSFGAFDNIRQELMSSSAPPCDMLVLAVTIEALAPRYPLYAWSVEEVWEQVHDFFELAAHVSASLIVVNTFLLPSLTESGLLGSMHTDGNLGKLAVLNQRVEAYVRQRVDRFILLDWNRYLRQCGEQQCLDARMLYLNKAPFKQDFLRLYAQDLARAVRALKGQAKKCLVLDCDGVLWGGIIGEDGIGNIRLDANEYPGKGYYDFQKTLLNLQQRGILLALCSRNNADDVWQVLDRHPACLLKREHIAAFRVNWEDKAQNIAALAAELNLGTNSFVFVDDSPQECERVRSVYPEIAVIRFPEKVFEARKAVLVDGYFDVLQIHQEDLQRGQMYRAESLRREQQKAFESVDDYLTSLELKARICRVSSSTAPALLGRIAQLTQKTNQFNLTTRRYSEADIRRLVADETQAVMALSVSDKYGDYGWVGVMIARRLGADVLMDSLLVSCRVLGRRIEQAFVQHCLDVLDNLWHPQTWLAEYIPTQKNMQVRDFWKELGFETLPAEGSASRYRMPAFQRSRSVPSVVTIIKESENGIS